MSNITQSKDSFTLSREELLKIAKLSCLELSLEEEQKFLSDLDKILQYIEEISNVGSAEEFFSTKNINVFREDKIKPSEGDAILKNSTHTSGRFFVIPRVLKH